MDGTVVYTLDEVEKEVAKISNQNPQKANLLQALETIRGAAPHAPSLAAVHGVTLNTIRSEARSMAEPFDSQRALEAHLFGTEYRPT